VLATWLTAFITCLVPLFIIVGPLGAVPLFLAITEGDDGPRRSQQARNAAFTVAAVLLLTALAGSLLLDLFDISVTAFRIAGGIILFIIGLQLLNVLEVRMKRTDEELAEARERNEVGITPMGIPMLAGPGAVTTVLAYRGQFGDEMVGYSALLAAIAGIALITWGILAAAARLQRRLGPIVLGVITRIEGLLLTSIAVQMLIDGIRSALSNG
jgi:multiple antibiotic resistance protein